MPTLPVPFLLAALLAGAPALARPVPLTLLHTACVRGRVLPAEDGAGGLLRLSAAVKVAREDAVNAFLLDSGDFFLGAPEAAASGGALPARVLAWLRPDFTVPGEADLALGLDAYRRWVTAAGVLPLAANASPTGALAGAAAWRLREVDGIRVAFVGLCAEDTAAHLRPEQTPGVRFLSASETLRGLLPALRQSRAEVRVLIVHAGGAARPAADQPLRALLRQFPDFDVVLGGHDGALVAEWRSENGPLYAEAGRDAEHLGRVDLVYDTVQRRVVSAAGRLLPVRSFSPDGDLMQALREDLDRAAARLARPLLAREDPPEGEASLLLAARPLRQPPGTVADLAALFPADEPLGVFTCSAHDLEQALIEAPAGARERLWLRGVALSAENNRVALTQSDGGSLNPRRRLRVTANARLLSSDGGDFASVRRMADAAGVSFPGKTLYAWLGDPSDSTQNHAPRTR